MEEEKSKMPYLVIGIMFLLLIFTGVQAVQINTVVDVMQSGAMVAASPSATVQQVSAPQAAPTMVGGC